MSKSEIDIEYKAAVAELEAAESAMARARVRYTRAVRAVDKEWDDRLRAAESRGDR